MLGLAVGAVAPIAANPHFRWSSADRAEAVPRMPERERARLCQRTEMAGLDRAFNGERAKINETETRLVDRRRFRQDGCESRAALGPAKQDRVGDLAKRRRFPPCEEGIVAAQYCLVAA